MTPGSSPAARPPRRQYFSIIAATSLAAVAVLTACQPAEPPRTPPPAAVAGPPPAAPRPAETAVNSLLLQYQDAAALAQNGFQIADEGGIVPLDQFERWTGNQLRELLQFVDAPNSGLSDSTRVSLGRALRDALRDKKDLPAGVSRTPAAPPKAAP